MSGMILLKMHRISTPTIIFCKPKWSLLLLVLLHIFIENISAQNFPPSPSDTLPLRDSTTFQTPDTSAVLYFYADNFKSLRVQDTLEKVHRYNPIFLQKYGYTQLGDFGSPHRQSVYQATRHEGISLGFHHYDLYLKKAEKLRLFNTSHPYSQFMYTAGATQEEGYVNAVFTQNISPNANAAIDYSRIIHRGGYDGQRVRHTNLGITAWLRSANDRYYGLLTYASNSIQQQNNGGIQGDSLLTDTLYFGNRDLIPTRLGETSQTEYTHDEWVYAQYFNLFRKQGKSNETTSPPLPIIDSLSLEKADTLKQKKKPIEVKKPVRPLQLGTGVSHRFRFKKEQLKFFDTQPYPASDSSFYDGFLTNEVGLRNFVRINKFENRFGGFLFLGKNEAFRFEPSITHAFVQIYEEPQDSLVQELRVSGDLSAAIGQFFKLSAHGHYELGANLGDYLLHGEAQLNFGKLGRLEGQLMQHQYAPDLLRHRLYVSQELVWENDFEKTNETNFTVAYHLPKAKTKYFEANISGGVENHLLNNLIYYDTLARPVQADGLKNIVQFWGQADLRFGKLYSENKVVLQQTGDDFLRLPRYWSRHSLYFQGEVFESAALLRAGVDCTYQSSYRSDDWWALTGQFYRQDEQNIVASPMLDVFFSFKVYRFRTFMKVSNVLQPWLYNTRLAAPNYPMRDVFFRFGVTWAFMD